MRGKYGVRRTHCSFAKRYKYTVVPVFFLRYTQVTPAQTPNYTMLVLYYCNKCRLDFRQEHYHIHAEDCGTANVQEWGYQ